MNEDNSFFFCSIETSRNACFLKVKDICEKYAKEHHIQVYILDKYLGDKKNIEYDVSDIAILLTPKHKIAILDYGQNGEEELEDFLDDLKEDLGYLSEKYDYSRILGRVRKWSDELFDIYKIDEFDFTQYIENEVKKEHIRIIDLLISLMIGSINDIVRIGIEEPKTLLDKVKRKIILYDALQSRFIYDEAVKKRVSIQGLAGTGKTELLLNKLKEIYINEKDSKVAFTCHNKVLASEMKENRIPRFFNFMKVEEQIDWENRLFVFSSWGSRINPNSGLISFICNRYGTTYKTFRQEHSFEELCKSIHDELSNQGSIAPSFDYIFVDESQDFGEEFFSLCECITKKTVYIAGDVFQNIFDSPDNSKADTIDYLLNKCYRTDPKTLMFAHAVGMGLYESPKINWMEEDGWIKCGYTYKKGKKIRLSREPLRRFEELELKRTIELKGVDSGFIVQEIRDQLNQIKMDNSTVHPNDIAIIVFSQNFDTICNYSADISKMITDTLGWKSTLGYITKRVENDSLYISNINNIKGLEFPFVICVVTDSISDNILYRNGIYTSLTRSFLKSVFLVNNKNDTFIKQYEQAISDIYKGEMLVDEPSSEEKQMITTNIRKASIKDRMTVEELVQYIQDEYDGQDLDLILLKQAATALSKKHKYDAEVIERLKKMVDQLI